MGLRLEPGSCDSTRCQLSPANSKLLSPLLSPSGTGVPSQRFLRICKTTCRTLLQRTPHLCYKFDILPGVRSVLWLCQPSSGHTIYFLTSLMWEYKSVTYSSNPAHTTAIELGLQSDEASSKIMYRYRSRLIGHAVLFPRCVSCPDLRAPHS